MLDFLNIPWGFILGGGLLTSIALILALWFGGKPVADIASAILTPLSKFAGETLVKIGNAFVDIISAGLNDIFDNTKTIITVAIITACCYGFTYYKFTYGDKSSCEQVIKELRKDFKFIPRRK